MYKIANEEAADIRIIRPDIPERLANVVALALSKRCETRYQDGDQLAADLRLVLADLNGRAPAATKSSIAAVPGMRRDSEVPALPVAADRTAVMAAAKTSPAARSAGVGAAAAALVLPSYDATGQATAGETDAFAKTAVIRRPAA
jgi:eukaryotic-like serine/threonine-protein kinase